MSEPREVRKVHELLEKMQDSKRVDPEEVAYYLRKAVNKKGASGLWIKREEDTKKEEGSISVVKVAYEKELVAVRVNARRQKGR